MSDWDLIVVGAGTAGMPCAIEAGRRGARVAVVEQDDEPGGTLHISSGQLSAAGTRRQRERGIEDSPDAHFADVMRIARGAADPVLVRLAVDEAPRTLDWLEDNGFDFAPEVPVVYHGHEPYGTARTYWGRRGGRSILAVLRPLWDEQVGAGRIEPLYGLELVELLVEDGAVVGVRARGPGGERELRAPATVLATGGYGSNPELFAEVTPGARLVSGARPQTRGGGILAARAVGAGFRNAEHYLPTIGGLEEEPGRLGVGPDGIPHFALLNANYHEPLELWVDERGERFVREDERSPDAVERAVVAAGGRFWVVFDEASLRGRSWHSGSDADALRARAWSGDDPRALAARAGVDPEGLARTIEAWNAGGPDPLGRERNRGPFRPPLHAALVHGVSVITFGGLHVDGELRVLDERGAPIPCLYAVGEALGAGATSGNAFCGGMLATPSLSFGRILGRKLAPVGATT